VTAVGERPDVAADDDWDFVHRRLPDFVRDETDAYIESVQQPIDIGTLFAATKAGTQREVGTRTSIMFCRVCGAPRQRESEYGTCAYCGTHFF
jgi:hypothetical protein